MSKITRKHTVTFYSPGTFCAETTKRDIREWDTREAMRLAATITERHGATPYGFQFATYVTSAPIPDGEGGELHVQPRLEKQSGMHFIKGELLTLADVEARGERYTILASNMRSNGWPLVVETQNGFRWVQPFEGEDCIVDADGTVTARATPHRRPQ